MGLETLRTLIPSIPRTASTTWRSCSWLETAMLMSRTIASAVISSASMAPMFPPLAPMADATLASIPGRLGTLTLITMLWASQEAASLVGWER